ncbi:heterokaryon incompatibility protein-domain-containing protein [Podospora appendiculata]|uniref:Heterokaryon incompatibility protein-domain-containing protein n=1 Tax=Podospora appendiculata TaxID=314037 RepID=A0AAE1C8S9_9PEZI|nr:heterokaryon incompatibility protein-domain-containing protein [Podospora appendiculata]
MRPRPTNDHGCDSAHEPHAVENEAHDVFRSTNAHRDLPTTTTDWTDWTASDKCKSSKQQDEATAEPNDSIPTPPMGSREAISAVSSLIPDYSDDLCSECRPLALDLNAYSADTTSWIHTKLGHIEGFITFCRKAHRDRDSSHVATASRDLPLLRVIDYQQTPLVVLPAPVGCSYIALSYVWGNHAAKNRSSTSSNDLADGEIPRVIVDAVEIVRRLGFRYLWVDQYGIQQDNADDKRAQIPNMDAIYHRAFLTIIAAAGDDCDYGLPGVHSPRQVREPVNISRISLTRMVLNASMSTDFLNSAWASRGCTYQEEVFSRRKLYFTDHQVFFECCRTRRPNSSDETKN